MQNRRKFIQTIPVVGAGILLGNSITIEATAQTPAEPKLGDGDPWASPSLRGESVVGPNGAVTTRAALLANEKWGIGEPRRVERVTDGVYALRGWGLGSSYAIEAPGGWIIFDTGDSTRAAAEMRAMLEETIGRKVKVAAMLLTHWHYADGTAAWLDEGAEVWGHEYLDRNRRQSKGISVLSGPAQARGAAQFGVFHPESGADAFPNMLGFKPEKLVAESSYQAPSRLFENGRVIDVVIAGEPMQVAPNRSDVSDSVGFYLSNRRMLVTNAMVPGGIVNVYSLRGSSYRDPSVLVEDGRWLESKNAEFLLDIHGPTVKGEIAVRGAVQRHLDQIQLMHDQTMRMIAHGLDARQAAEQVYMPGHQRGDWETYGQVESHVRGVYGGTMGWFGNDVYEINPLSLNEEAARTVAMMGGPAAVRNAATEAANNGGLANWRWSLKLTSMLLQLDPSDVGAKKARATASRQLGQRTSSANARGWYVTEALQIEGGMQFKGQPLTIDTMRRFLGTPTAQALTAASVDENLQFVRYLVDPRKAEDQRHMLTIAVEGEPGIRRLELRNGVLVITGADKAAATHLALTRRELAAFVLGTRTTAAADALSQIDKVLDRSHMMPPGAIESVMAGMKAPADSEH